MINFNAIPNPQAEQIPDEQFSLERELMKMNKSVVQDFARDYPNQFMQLAVEEIGTVELAEYLHETHDLFELIPDLEAEVVANLENESDYYSQIKTNYRG